MKRRSDTIEYFADLPYSIITNILLQLPIKAIFTCKCVCRTWNSLIIDPYFAALYTEPTSLNFMVRTSRTTLVSNTLHLFDFQPQKIKFHHYFVNFNPKFKLPLRTPKRTRHYPHQDPIEDKFDVVNSCNGLLCLCESNGFLSSTFSREPGFSPKLYSVHHLVVCNPITGEFIRLPEATGFSIYTARIPICAGLGFQPKTNEYKVIRVWKWRDYKPNSMVVEMHTLGTTTWRNIEVDPMFSSSRLESPTSLNGALHWINFHNKKQSILCLNLETERFESFPCPSSLSDVEVSITMVELKGFLYLCEQMLPNNTCSIWLMKEYGIGESWTKVFCSDNFKGFPWTFGVCKPIKHFENGCGAILVQKSHSCKHFIYYELDKDRFTYLNIDGDESFWYESILHIPSLVSLKDVAKGNKVEVQNVHFMVPSKGKLKGQTRSN